jgi:uncharacterized membrane-anchored protein
MKNRSAWLAIIIALQSLWLIATAISKEGNLRRATPANIVLLETMPVDPRDLLRGDFVILNYKIGSMPIATLQTGSPALDGRTVWVALEKRGKFHEIAEASLNPIEEAAGRIITRGTIETHPNGPLMQQVQVTYGIERYYVPEGLGNPNGKVTVECVVTDDRTLQIKQMFVNDRPFDRSASTAAAAR